MHSVTPEIAIAFFLGTVATLHCNPATGHVR